MLREAGIRTLQPGIESFSDAVLALMRKGVSGLQNIQLLKWCKELGIEPYWNILWGFPGEPPEEYARMADLVPLLSHLQPPIGYGSIRLDRFSPNFADAERLGFTDVRPLAPYGHVYPLTDEARANLAYFFAFQYREPRDVAGYVRPLAKALDDWKRLGGRSDLFSVDTGLSLIVWDLRPAAREPLTVLRDVDRILYQACDAACDVRQLAEIASRHGAPISREDVERRLEPLLAHGLVLREGARYLALAIPLGEYAPPALAVERFYEVAGAMGKRAARQLVVPLARPEIEAGAARFRRRPRASRHNPLRRHPKTSLSLGQFSVSERGELVIQLTRA